MRAIVITTFHLVVITASRSFKTLTYLINKYISFSTKPQWVFGWAGLNAMKTTIAGRQIFIILTRSPTYFYILDTDSRNLPLCLCSARIWPCRSCTNRLCVRVCACCPGSCQDQDADGCDASSAGRRSLTRDVSPANSGSTSSKASSSGSRRSTPRSGPGPGAGPGPVGGPGPGPGSAAGPRPGTMAGSGPGPGSGHGSGPGSGPGSGTGSGSAHSASTGAVTGSGHGTGSSAVSSPTSTSASTSTPVSGSGSGPGYSTSSGSSGSGHVPAHGSWHGAGRGAGRRPASGSHYSPAVNGQQHHPQQQRPRRSQNG